MNDRQLWQLFLETGAPEVYLEYRQAHGRPETGLSAAHILPAPARQESAQAVPDGTISAAAQEPPVCGIGSAGPGAGKGERPCI